MAKSKTVLALVAVAAAAYGGDRLLHHGCCGGAATDATDGGTVATIDRVWIDHLPRNPTDKIQVFIALSEEVAGDDVGIFQNTSQWSGAFEMFTYAKDGDKLVAKFPQTSETQKLSPRATKCDRDGWNFCLELNGTDRGTKNYYSIDGWEIRGHHSRAEIEAQVEAIEAAAAAVPR